jgi:3-isopropylmalate/(R)-2-methylmalate dehydratase large subunit
MTGKTLFDKIWDSHVIRDLGDGWALLHIDRHLLTDGSGPAGFEDLRTRGLHAHDPDLVFATPDHVISSQPGRDGTTFKPGAKLWMALRDGARQEKVRNFDIGEAGQGIVHVMGPELAIVLPGLTVTCGDSHTCTNGGLGAMAFGVGSSENAHVLASQTLRQQKPKQLRIRCEGNFRPGVTAKDLALHIIGRLGAAAGVGHAVEYCGSAVEAMDVEARLTLCNLSVELGAKVGMVAPDERTFNYLEGRQFAPKGEDWAAACEYWKTLRSDPDARFDREVVIQASDVSPTITWGTSPEHAIAADGHVPDPAAVNDPDARTTLAAALDYMGLQAGQPIAGTRVDRVFIGSCTNSRISDLRAAASVVRGRHVAPWVTAWVVPGSENVKRQAESEGLHTVFQDAGFSWREPGCSMCVAANGEQVPPGQRCVSTSNRNFVGRQGPGARTHLASPLLAAAAAIAGAITTPETLP